MGILMAIIVLSESHSAAMGRMGGCEIMKGDVPRQFLGGSE